MTSGRSIEPLRQTSVNWEETTRAIEPRCNTLRGPLAKPTFEGVQKLLRGVEDEGGALRWKYYDSI